MADILDPDPALFAGLNAIPERATLTECSGCPDPRLTVGFMDRWHSAVNGLGEDPGGGASFDLDCGAVPRHG